MLRGILLILLLGSVPGNVWGTSWGARDKTLVDHMQGKVPLLFHLSGPETFHYYVYGAFGIELIKNIL